MSNFTQNAKMKKSSQNGTTVYNFGIPAFMSQDGTKTCPMAKACVAGCYARQGTYQFSNVKAAYERRLEFTKSETFRTEAILEISALLGKAKKKGSKLVIRVHDSGDFYSEAYQLNWYDIARVLPEVQFYAYTKSVSQSKRIDWSRPRNFKLIFSYGGAEDQLINPEVDSNAKVFKTEVELSAEDYLDVTNDDMLLFKTNKIGLVYHGTKKFENTTWSRANNTGGSQNEAA